MTKWTKVEFSDLREGDTIKSVNPAGTTTVGVVTGVDRTYAIDGSGMGIAKKGRDTLYRRTPKFVAPDVPEVGQWIAATLRDGRVVSGRVTEVRDESQIPEKRDRAWCVDLAGSSVSFFICAHHRPNKDSRDILSWTPIDPPAPAEPTAAYSVVHDNAGFAWVRNAYGTWVPVDCVAGTSPLKWPEFVKRFSPVTVRSEGGAK